MSQVDFTRNGGQQRSAREAHRPDVPVWTAILAGSVVLGAVGAALVFAEHERTRSIRGYLEHLWSERE